MQKPAEELNMFRFLGRLGDTVSRIDGLNRVANMLGSIFGAALGRNQQTSGESHANPEKEPQAKGIDGIFGFGDERKWLALLEVGDQELPGLADIVTDFKAWAFMYQGESHLVHGYIWLVENRFRTLIVEMGSTVGSESGDTITTTIKGTVDGLDVNRVHTEKLRIPGVSNPKQLLLRMVSLINKNKTSDTKKGREKGFMACREYLRQNGVPFPKAETIRLLEELEASSRGKVSELWPQAMEVITRTNARLELKLTQAADIAEAWQQTRARALAVKRDPANMSWNRLAFEAFHRIMMKLF